MYENGHSNTANDDDLDHHDDHCDDDDDDDDDDTCPTNSHQSFSHQVGKSVMMKGGNMSQSNSDHTHR